METAVGKKKRPLGIYVCAIGFTFERCAFYTVKYLLAIQIATNAAGGGLGLTDADTSLVAALFVAFTQASAPFFGSFWYPF